MKRAELLFVNDILQSIVNIKNFSKSLTKETFKKNVLKQSAIIRQFEIIGEAVKNISTATRKKYPHVEWRKIAGSRDVFIHGYFMVDLDKVWDLIKKEVPKLEKQVKRIRDDVEK
jgi:uncharacterized protein with HEPN domain